MSHDKKRGQIPNGDRRSSLSEKYLNDNFLMSLIEAAEFTVSRYH